MNPQSTRSIIVFFIMLLSQNVFAKLTVTQAHKVMEDVKFRIIETVNSRSSDNIADIFTEDGILILSNADLIRTRKNIRQFIKAPYLSDTVKIDRFIIDKITMEEPLVILNNNTFLATGTAQYQIVFNKSKSLALSNRWIMVVTLENDQWKVASYQGTLNAFSNPYLSDMKRTAYFLCMVTFILGIITHTLMRKIRKKSKQ